MIKRLRIKFIIVTMGVLLIVFGIVLLAINISMYTDSLSRSERLLEMIVEGDGLKGMFPKENGVITPDNQNGKSLPVKSDFPNGGGHYPNAENGPNGQGTFFYAKTDDNYKITESFYDMMLEFSDTNISHYIELAVATGSTRGSIENLEFRIEKKDYGYIIAFVERSVESGILNMLLKNSALIMGISSLVLAVFVFFLSKWIVKPVQNSFESQRRFISDASHELKTPLTIISANADVLENEIGENKQLSHIKSQTERMGHLVHNMLDLMRTDDYKESIVFVRFNMSEVVLGTTLEFESRVFEDGKKLSYDIAENIELLGDEEKIRQLTAILLDNAIKHSDRGGEIGVSLKKLNNKTVLAVKNTGAGVSETEREKIFERFYRSDISRSRETGGYGLGLAIAKSIVLLHKGKIIAEGEEGSYIEFIVTV